MPVCLNCGHSVRNKTGRRFIKSCSRCTKLFSDNVKDDIDNMIKEFLK